MSHPLRLCLGLLFATAALAACSHHNNNTYQGYVEGEFVYLGSSQSGTLTQLAVTRGQTVAASAPVFTLESADEAAALQQAQRTVEAAGRKQAGDERLIGDHDVGKCQ